MGKAERSSRGASVTKREEKRGKAERRSRGTWIARYGALRVLAWARGEGGGERGVGPGHPVERSSGRPADGESAVAWLLPPTLRTPKVGCRE